MIILIEEKVLRVIKEYFLANKSVAAVYLFGSTVKGKERTGSDIDLAVLFYPQLDKVQRFSAKLGIVNDLEEIFNKRGHKIRFDVVDIKSADLFFIHQIMKNKRIIVDKDPHYRVEFEVTYRRNFFDLRDFYELYHKQVLRRLKERL